MRRRWSSFAAFVVVDLLCKDAITSLHSLFFDRRHLNHFVLGTRLLSRSEVVNGGFINLLLLGCFNFKIKFSQAFFELQEIKSSSLMNLHELSVSKLLESLKPWLVNLLFVPLLHQSILFPEFVHFISLKVKDCELTLNALLVLFLCHFHELRDMFLKLYFKSGLLLHSRLALWICWLGKVVLRVIFKDRVQLCLWLHALALIVVLEERMVLGHILKIMS